MSDELPDPSELLRAYSAGAKKRFGQHFLTDFRLLDRIVRAAGIEAGDHVLEIGPGCGTLTSRLLRAGAHVTAVELDRDAAAFVRDVFVGQSFELVEADAVSVNFAELLAGKSWKVAANLPYNVGTQIMFTLLESGAAIDRLALMFQLEVAQRIVAEPRTKAYGAMTLQVRELADARVAFRVKPGAFTPPPKVDSAVVVLQPFEDAVLPDELSKTFRSVVTAGFGQRRKTLRNSLGASVGVDRASAALEAAAIDSRARAEELDFESFVRLASAIQDQQ